MPQDYMGVPRLSLVWGLDGLRLGWELLLTRGLVDSWWRAAEPPWESPIPRRHEEAGQGGPRTSMRAGARSSQWFPGKPANTVQMGCIFRKASSPLPPSLPSFLMCAHSSIPLGGELKEGPPPWKTLPPLGLF